MVWDPNTDSGKYAIVLEMGLRFQRLMIKSAPERYLYLKNNGWIYVKFSNENNTHYWHSPYTNENFTENKAYVEQIMHEMEVEGLIGKEGE